jgi:gliding motility-associated-like protein
MTARFFRLFVSFCVGLTCGMQGAMGQLDTEFWFVAPEVWDGHGDDPILLRFSTLGDPAEVTVELPANPIFPVQTLNIPANGTQTLDLTPWLSDIENKPFNTVLNKGIRITSDASVTAYYEINHPDNPDIFALKGASALGEMFFVPFQNYLDNVYQQSTASIDIVATEDGTEITVTPTTALTGYAAGVPFVIELDQGETYALRAASVLAASHPSGTLVQSSAPIAVTISDDSLLGAPFNPSGCYDVMGDQVIPVEVAGKEYIAIKGNLGGPDKVFIVGTEDNTSISINGTNVWTVDAGETYAHTLSAPAAFYETSAPAIALHMTGFGCEVGGAILPPITCTGSDEVAFVRSPANNSGTPTEFAGLKIIVPSGAEGDFEFNGSAANVGAMNFNPVPGSGGEWMYANITGTGFIPTNSASRLVNTTAKFHLGLINGGAQNGTRYGYFSDFSKYQHSTFTSDNQLCAGETAELFASPILEASYEWVGPNGFEAEGNEIAIGPLTVDDAGLYVVSGMAGECEILPDTLELFVAPQPPAPEVVPIDALCEGDDWSFTSLTAADNWIWENAAGDIVFEGDSTASYSNAQPSDAGEYTLIIEAESCLSEPTTFELVVTETIPAPLDPEPIEICEGSSLTLEPDATLPDATWEWTLPSGDAFVGELLFIQTTAAADAGTYTLNGTNSGCPLVPSEVDVSLSSPEPVNVTAPEFVCNDASAVLLTTDDLYSGDWTGTCADCLSANGQLTPADASPGIVSITYSSDNPCAQTTTVEVEIGSVPDAAIDDQSFCLGTGEVAMVPVTNGGSWTAACIGCCTSDGVFDTQSAGTGAWDLTYTIDGTCPATGTATFTVTPNTSSAFALIPEFCPDHDPAVAVPEETGGNWTASCTNCISSTGQFSPQTAGAGLHTVSYTIPGACGTSTDATVTVYELPEADFTFSPNEGCAPAVVACSAPVNPSIVDCQWTFNANGVGASMACDDHTFVIENPGCYLMSHTVLDNNGCTNTATAAELLCLSAPPSSAFSLTPAQASIFDTHIEAWASDSIETNTYVWNVGDVPMGEGANQSFSIPEIGLDAFQLCMEATDSVGCSSLTCALIDLTEGLNAFAPNAFTPDNDGHNDAWRMYTSGAVTRFELRIYDRWGALVFASEDPEANWVGDVQGGDHFAPDGVYHYEAVLRDDAYSLKTLQGHILLIR